MKIIPMTKETEQKAELTLLALIEKAGGQLAEENKILASIGCSRGELEHLQRKYSRVLARWREEGSKG